MNEVTRYRQLKLFSLSVYMFSVAGDTNQDLRLSVWFLLKPHLHPRPFYSLRLVNSRLEPIMLLNLPIMLFGNASIFPYYTR